MEINIRKLKEKADVMVVGTESTIIGIEITEPKVSGRKLGNAESPLYPERSIIVTVYVSDYQECIAFEFPTLKQFENHFKRAIENLQSDTDKYSYLSKSSVTTFKTIYPTIAQSTAEIHAAEDKLAEIMAEEDNDNDDWGLLC